MFPLYTAVVANRRLYGEDQPDPLPEGKTLEEVTILSTDDFIGVTQNLRDVKER